MATKPETTSDIRVDPKALYLEEVFTDRRVGTIRRLTPVGKDGYYTYGGRSDDMLKVGGIYVSPVEVEMALSSHEAVLEAAVVGAEDDSKLIKPKAYVVLKSGNSPDEKLKTALQQHVKAKLAPYKYPRWIEFLNELPKTATGKIQRFKLR